MATVSKIVSRSLRLLKVLDANEVAEAEQAEQAIDALNAMCTRWEANGLSIGWANVSGPDDTMPSPDEAEEAIVFNLAVRIAGEYSPPSSFASVSEGARLFLAELRRDRLASAPLTLKTDLPARCGGYDMYTDTYN